MVKMLVRSLMCLEVDEDLNPCSGTCNACVQMPGVYSVEGLFSEVSTPKGQIPVDLSVIDCTQIITPGDLLKVLHGIEVRADELRIVYFDEVHRLVKRGMDEMLLKQIEDKPVMWIFSTAETDNLEPMFLNRCLKLETEEPCVDEMESWLCDRCDEHGIRWTPEAVIRVVKKSNRTPGLALQALALAELYSDGLTLDLVENDWKVRVE